MKITCHSCGAKYTVSDEKVQGKTVKMKCRKCGSTIVVGGASGAAEAGGDDASIAAADAPAAGSYLVNVGENDQRTMTLAEVVEAYNGGVISADTYVFTDGMADWQALQENEVIVAALNEAAMASAAYGGNGGANGGYAQEPAAAASAPAYDPAPYNPPAAASFSPAPAADARPAAARRDAGRKSQDLFGGGYGADTGGGMSTASAIGSVGTGKREENSVLFSLNALTANAPAPARSSATTATKEDSGLIDLKALAAAAPPAQAEAAPTPMIDTVGLFPLGAPVAAPQPAYAAPVAAGPVDTKKSPLPLIVGGVVAVAAIVGVFLFVLRGGEPEKKPETAKAETTQTATAAPPATTQTVAASATTTVAGPDTAAPDPSGAASVAAGPKGPKGPYKPGPKSTGAAAAGTPTATTAKPPPPKDKCNCGGNLDCQIKCSIKGK